MHVLMMTPRIDAKHDVLGFAVKWVRELSRHFDRLDVLTGYAGEYDLPENVTVRSYGKERGYSKSRRVIEFERHCATYARENQIDVAFVHMVPAYVLASWPLLGARGVPYVLWYAHGTVTSKLRAAHPLVSRVVTSTPASFNLSSKKVEIVGQGINMEEFTHNREPRADGHLLGVGRIDPVKNFDVLIAAVADIHERKQRVSLNIVGEPFQSEEYRKSLGQQVRDSGLDDVVRFVGSVPHEAIVDYYQSAKLFLNASRTGSLDKTEVEAMACGTPVISCNDSYCDMVEETPIDADLVTFPPGDAVALADRVEAILGMDEAEYRELQRQSRDAVKRRHALQKQIERIADAMKTTTGET